MLLETTLTVLHCLPDGLFRIIAIANVIVNCLIFNRNANKMQLCNRIYYSKVY